MNETKFELIKKNTVTMQVGLYGQKQGMHQKAIDTNQKIKHKVLEDILGKDFDDPNVVI